MKRLIASAVLAAIVGVASAQQTTIRPDYNGGYVTTAPNGQTTTIRPDYNGGYVVRGQQGQTTTIRPDYNGGYVVQPQYPYNRPYR
jgi:hypothetical protein